MLKTEQKKTKKDDQVKMNPERMELEDKLFRHLGIKVRVKGAHNRGRIVLEYYSAEELDRLVETLLG